MRLCRKRKVIQVYIVKIKPPFVSKKNIYKEAELFCLDTVKIQIEVSSHLSNLCDQNAGIHF